MKIDNLGYLIIAILLGSQVKADAEISELSIGDSAPLFNLLGVDGEYHRLEEYADSKLLLVIFLSNSCPYSHAIEDRLIQIVKDYPREDLAVVAISPNHPDAIRLDELGYSKYSDSYPEMILYAKEREFNFPYLYDGDTQLVAKSYGCLATPHAFLFDEKRKLKYQGMFDDSRYPDPETVTQPKVRNAIDRLLRGEALEEETTRVMGCATKWLENIPKPADDQENWSKSQVKLKLIDESGISAFVTNTTNRVRLINVWATWCAPCVREFPELIELSQRFANRDFELITINIDGFSEFDNVYQFLKEQHAAPSNRLNRIIKREGYDATNFQYKGESMDKLACALDSEWKGPVPYTIVVNPVGEIVYRKMGAFDSDELISVLIDHLGSYYNPKTKR